MKLKSYWFFLVVFLLVWGPSSQKSLTLHGIAHSHNDAGWLMSFENYYITYTKNILDSTWQALVEDKDLIFHWADMAFFHYWYTQQNETTQSEVHKLVDEGRYVFIGGGWVMNDEALPSYKEMMLNMRTGLDFLRNEFQVRPTIGWQIDPFGSSTVTVTVLDLLGYDALVYNRMSANLKQKMALQDGFNFYYQGHQVSPNPEGSSLFTHILQKHYNSIPVWPESSVINTAISSKIDQIYKDEITPAVTAQQVLSNGKMEAMDTMICLGDDFEFNNATSLFKKYTELMQAIKTKGLEEDLDIEYKYSSLYEYFQALHDSNLTFGYFNGDFLPYHEPKQHKNIEDFWTGYYSTRLHLKRYIRYTFNHLQSSKMLFASVALAINGYSVDFSAEKENILDEVQHHITEAERNWAILMHHDAITGTHDQVTEPSYYETLKEALGHISEVYTVLERNTEEPFNMHHLNSILDKLTHPVVTVHYLANPEFAAREQIFNVSLPYSERDHDYVFVLQTPTEVKVINEVHYIDMEEIDSVTFEMSRARKAFFRLSMQGLSNYNLYVISTCNHDDCGKDGISCARKADRQVVKKPWKISNDNVTLTFDERGGLSSYHLTIDKNVYFETPIEEELVYYPAFGRSRSGHYIFNPNERQKFGLDLVKAFKYSIGSLGQILQVHGAAAQEHILKTYSVYNYETSEELQKQFGLEVQFFSYAAIEASISLKIHEGSKKGEYRSYADDSMKLVQRPSFTKNVNVVPDNNIEKLGYFTYPCVHGGAIRKSTTNKNKQSNLIFGWSNSNPIGCTFSEKNKVELMIFRRFYYSDHKGVASPRTQNHPTQTSFQFYFDFTSVNSALSQRSIATALLNSPITSHSFQATVSALPTLLPPLDLGEHVKVEGRHLEIAEVKLTPNVLTQSNKYTLSLVLRNQYSTPQAVILDLNNHHVFKNPHVGVLKSGKEEKFSNKCNKNWRVLENDRYEISTLDQEFEGGQGVKGDIQLEAFEVAEFNIVTKQVYDEIMAEVHTMGQGETVTCEKLDLVKATRQIPGHKDAQFLKWAMIIIFAVMAFVAIGLVFSWMKQPKEGSGYQVEMDSIGHPHGRDSEVEDNQIR